MIRTAPILTSAYIFRARVHLGCKQGSARRVHTDYCAVCDQQIYQRSLWLLLLANSDDWKDSIHLLDKMQPSPISYFYWALKVICI